MHGKWSAELNQINQINIHINLFELDVAQIKSTSPRNFVDGLTQKLNKINANINTHQERSFFDVSRRHIVVNNIKLSQDRLNNLLNHILQAENRAKMILDDCRQATENTIQRYSFNPDHSHIIDPSNRLSDTFSTPSPFSNINTAGGMVWASVRAQKSGIAKISGYTQTDSSSQLLHNSLVHLLETNDKELVDAIDSDKLTIEGEIGHLILQRLKDIQHGGGSFSQERPAKELVNMCAKAITRAIGNNTNDGIFKCDFDAFYVELTKLALHARLHPMSKKIWLGTARVVIAVISENVGNGTYLNCDEKKWTWHLNRMWLHAAIHLGYSIELIEQHFPKVESALLCRDGGASFALTLLTQVRANPSVRSQYDGYDAPTATAQEILVLLDIGCLAEKSHENNRIIFSKGGPRETPSPRSFWLNCAQVSVSNSWDSASPPASPLRRSPTQFFLSEISSSELRRNNSKLFLPIENVIRSDDTIIPSSLSL